MTRPTLIGKDTSPDSDISGRSMDRRVDRTRVKIALGAGAAVLAVLAAAFVWTVKPAPAGTHVVKASRLQIVAATRGMFDESISVLGAVAPAETFLIDAVEGGRIDRVLVSNGDVVEAGQTLLELTNTQLQLDVLARETEVAAQMNSLRSQELQLERNRLNDSQSIARGEAEVDRLERQVERSERLAKEGAFAQATLEDLRSQLDLQKKLLEIQQSAEITGERMNTAQVEQMRIATERLERNLAAARNSLAQLKVRAPTAGMLTSFTPQLGQTLARGVRIGQIDAAEGVKISATLDEYYLSRVSTGLPGEASVGDKPCPMKVGRVSNQVEAGQFKADLLFDGDCGAGQLRRGQSVPVKITLGEPQPALMAPNGPYIIATGGRWAFVVSSDGKSAQRRDITLGRRSASAVEILKGVEAGERIVVSGYDGFAEAKALQLRK